MLWLYTIKILERADLFKFIIFFKGNVLSCTHHSAPVRTPNCQIFGMNAGSANSRSTGASTKMLSPCQTISAMSANKMFFSRDKHHHRTYAYECGDALLRLPNCIDILTLLSFSSIFIDCFCSKVTLFTNNTEEQILKFKVY